MIRLKISGTGSYVPSEIISNSLFEGRDLYIFSVDEKGEDYIKREQDKFVENRRLTSEGILQRTGILQRRRSQYDEFPSDMGAIAAKKAIDDAGIDKEDLEGIIFTSVTENVISQDKMLRPSFPNGAQRVKDLLEIRRTDLIALNIENACSGFTSALEIADALAQKRGGNYLVIGSDALTKISYEKSANSILWGDGAGAFVLSPSYEGEGFVKFDSGSDCSIEKQRWVFLGKDGKIRMPNGRGVYLMAKEKMSDTIVRLSLMTGLRPDVVVPHQANQNITDQIPDVLAKRGFKINAQMISNIKYTGNMGAATIPVAIDQKIKTGELKLDGIVSMVTFAAGLTWGGAIYDGRKNQ